MSTVGDYLQLGEDHNDVYRQTVVPRSRKDAKLQCAECGCSFETSDDLSRHLSTEHPKRKPTLFIDGRECVEPTVPIRQPITPSSIAVKDCNIATLNGTRISTSSLPLGLVRIACGTSINKLELVSDAGITRGYTLECRVPTESSLHKIEDVFAKSVINHPVNNQVIDSFIAETSECKSDYREGICEYLYGVLIRNGDSLLPYHTYGGRFRRAANLLTYFPRRLANAIRSLIAFHFNSFHESIELAGPYEVALAAKEFVVWLKPGSSYSDSCCRPGILSPRDSSLISIADQKTRDILRWSRCSYEDMSDSKIDEIESSLNSLEDEYDEIKLRVILERIYYRRGRYDHSLEHLRALRNAPVTSAQAFLKIRNRINRGRYEKQ